MTEAANEHGVCWVTTDRQVCRQWQIGKWRWLQPAREIPSSPPPPSLFRSVEGAGLVSRRTPAMGWVPDAQDNGVNE